MTYCPMGCGKTLFLGSGGYVTCSYIHCPRPTAVADLLEDQETEHVVEISDDAFTVRHPLYLASLNGPPHRPGRYRAATLNGEWHFVGPHWRGAHSVSPAGESWGDRAVTDSTTLDRQGHYVKSVVERIRYKRGWTFRVLPCQQTPGWLWLEAESIESDSRSEGVSRNQFRTYLIAAHQDRGKIIASVRHAIQTWELHETDEWLTFDGERVHDPHACDECFVGNKNHHPEGGRK